MAEAVNVDALLGEAAAFLEAAALNDERTPYFAAHALRLVLKATDLPNAEEATPGPLARLSDAFDAAVVVVREDVGDALPDGHVGFAMGAACSLIQFLGRTPADLTIERDRIGEIWDRIDYTVLLANELEALYRRRRIERRGDLLRQSIEMQISAPVEIPAGVQIH